MSEDIQGLLEKINREGVEKARAEGERILSEARAQAEAVVREAENAAAKKAAEAERGAKVYADGAEQTVRQAVRDLVSRVEQSIQALLENLLAKDVDLALADEKTVAAVASEAVRETAGSGEFTASSRTAAMLRAQLASLGSFKVVVDESVGSGFSVKVDGGRVEHDFTAKAIAEELSRRLRPDLAALLK